MVYSCDFLFPKTYNNPHRPISIIKNLYWAPRGEEIKKKIYCLKDDLFLPPSLEARYDLSKSF